MMWADLLFAQLTVCIDRRLLRWQKILQIDAANAKIGFMVFAVQPMKERMTVFAIAGNSNKEKKTKGE